MNLVVPLCLVFPLLFSATDTRYQDRKNNYPRKEEAVVNASSRAVNLTASVVNAFRATAATIAQGETFQMRRNGDVFKAFVSVQSKLGRQEKRRGNVSRDRRHTPFLPNDYWDAEKPPEFGATVTNVTAVVNATARLVCPIGHIQDSAVSTVHTYSIVTVEL